MDILQADGIPHLIRLLWEHSTAGGKEAASVCLWNLACNAENRVAIQAPNWHDPTKLRGIPSLVKLLGHPESKVRKVMAVVLHTSECWNATQAGQSCV